MNIPILIPEHRWYCPNCLKIDVTHEAQPHTRFHQCDSFGGLAMPMVREGVKAKVTLREREDYLGDETVTTLEGRPIMSAVTEREDGSNDVAVFAPLAKGKVGELG